MYEIGLKPFISALLGAFFVASKLFRHDSSYLQRTRLPISLIY